MLRQGNQNLINCNPKGMDGLKYKQAKTKLSLNGCTSKLMNCNDALIYQTDADADSLKQMNMNNH